MVVHERICCHNGWWNKKDSQKINENVQLGNIFIHRHMNHTSFALTHTCQLHRILEKIKLAEKEWPVSCKCYFQNDSSTAFKCQIRHYIWYCSASTQWWCKWHQLIAQNPKVEKSIAYAILRTIFSGQGVNVNLPVGFISRVVPPSVRIRFPYMTYFKLSKLPANGRRL